MTRWRLQRPETRKRYIWSYIIVGGGYIGAAAADRGGTSHIIPWMDAESLLDLAVRLGFSLRAPGRCGDQLAGVSVGLDQPLPVMPDSFRHPPWPTYYKRRTRGTVDPGTSPGWDRFNPCDADSGPAPEAMDRRHDRQPAQVPGPGRGPAADRQARSNRSRFITLVHAATKAFTKAGPASSVA